MAANAEEIVHELRDNQFALKLGEPAELTDKSINIEKKADGGYRMTITVDFESAKEFTPGPNEVNKNIIDGGEGSLSVLTVGRVAPVSIENPKLKFLYDQGLILELSMKVPNGFLGKKDHATV